MMYNRQFKQWERMTVEYNQMTTIIISKNALGMYSVNFQPF